jgi:hypothetical protein
VDTQTGSPQSTPRPQAPQAPSPSYYRPRTFTQPPTPMSTVSGRSFHPLQPHHATPAPLRTQQSQAFTAQVTPSTSLYAYPSPAYGSTPGHTPNPYYPFLVAQPRPQVRQNYSGIRFNQYNQYSPATYNKQS